MTTIDPRPTLKSYPPKPFALRYYPTGWWVLHPATDRVGRVLRQSGRKYHIWFPGTARTEVCQAGEILSATANQVLAIQLHPLSSAHA